MKIFAFLKIHICKIIHLFSLRDKETLHFTKTIITQVEVPDRNSICPDSPRRKMSKSRSSQTESAYYQTVPDAKVPMTRPSQTESAYDQTVPDGKCLWSDRPRRKMPKSRSSQTERAYDQTAPDGKCLWSDRPRRKAPMTRPSQTESAYDQTVPDRKCLCPDYRAFKTFSAFFVHSKSNMPDPPRPKAYMSRLSCVHVQTIVRSSVFPDRVILNARLPLRAFISVWTCRVSVWHLNLGTSNKHNKFVNFGQIGIFW